MAEEKVYVIPLGDAYMKARVRRTPCAARAVRAFLQTHTRAKTVKLGRHLNEALWARSTKKPPRSVRVRAVVDGNIAKAELFGHEYEEFKPLSVAKKEKLVEKLKARLGAKAEKTEELEKKIEGKEEKTSEPSEHVSKTASAPEQKSEQK